MILKERLSKIDVGVHEDNRRTITDFALPADVELPFPVRQVKIVALKQDAVDRKLVVGNHYHTAESNRWEFFVAVGPKDVPLFLCASRLKREGPIWGFRMKAGDTWLIAPTESHAFRPVVAGASLWGVSNLSYNAAHDTPDILFSPAP